jgi:HPt (histidine-containing phosphotransfer) domain-containing protein
VAQLFDEAELMERVDNDLEFLADTVQMLETDGRALVAEIRTAVASGDSPAVGRAAHALKGMISNFCSPAVQTLAFDVEKAGKAGDGAGAAAASVKLEPSLEALVVELAAFVRSRS